MFRMKKPTESDRQQPIVQRQEPVQEPPVAKSPPRRTLPMPPRPTNVPSEIPKRAESPTLPSRADAAAARDKSLVIGKDVRLKGQISACDKLILDGDAEIELTGCRQLQIGASGCFRGSADVAEADIGGHFEGDLIARERLTVRPTGRVRGTFRYTRVTIEAGGQVTGEMMMLEPADPATADAQMATRTEDPQAATPPGLTCDGSSEAEAVPADHP